METAERDTDHSTGLPPLRVAVGPSEHEETELKDELLTVLLHDLRSPVGAVGVLADLISTMLAKGEIPNANQITLLKESVTKTQRVLDDAVEIQSIIRGSSTLTSSEVDLDLLIDACIEKARHAAYFRNTQIESQIAPDRLFVHVDIEKMEAVVLCLLEQIITNAPNPLRLVLGASIRKGFVILHLESDEKTNERSPLSSIFTTRPSLRGRLGSRRLGESRYNFQICQKVLSLMGCRLDIIDSDPLSLDISIPAASN